MSLGYDIGLGLAARYPSGGSVSPVFQFLPSLPTPDAIVGDRASLLAAIAAAPAPGGSIYNIAIDETALPTYSTYDAFGNVITMPQLDLGITDGTLGTADMRIATGGKNLRFYPKGGYGAMYAHPLIGDGRYYDFAFARKLNIRGMFDVNGGNVEFLGLRFHLSNAFPAVNKSVLDLGMASRPAMINVRGAANLKAQGCESTYGRLGTGQMFDPSENLVDYNSPNPFWRLNELTYAISGPTMPAAAVTASITGSTMDVTAVTSGTLLVGMTLTWGGSAKGFILEQLTGTPGGIGTYKVTDNSQTNLVASFAQASTTVTGGYSYGSFTGWGDDMATQCLVNNRYVSAPRFIVGSGGVTTFTGSITMLDNYVHGVSIALQAYLRGTKMAEDMIIGRNFTPFILMDHYNFACETGDEFRKARFFNNVGFGAVANNYDSGNPHPDYIQIQATYNNAAGQPISGFKSGGNVVVTPKQHRGIMMQVRYMPLSNSHLATANDWPYAQGFAFEDEVTVGCIKDLVFDVASNALWWNNVSLNEDDLSVRQRADGTYASITPRRGMAGKSFLAPEGVMHVKNSIYEIVFNDWPLDVVGSNNLMTGISAATPAARTVPLASILNNPTATIATVNDGYLFAKSKAGSVAEGKGIRSASLYDHLTLGYASSFALGFATRKNADLSTLTQSSAGYVFGAEDTVYNVTPGAGVEWSATDAYGAALTPARGWSSSAGTVPEGALMSLRATTSAIGSKRATYLVNVNGQDIPWIVQTKSTITMPSVTLGAQDFRRTTTNFTGVTDSKKLSFAVRFKLASIGVAHSIIVGGTGAFVSISINSTNRVNIALRNAGSLYMLNLQSTPTLAANTWYTIACSIDLDQPSTETGVQLLINGVPVTTWVTNAFTPANSPILFTNGQTWAFFGNASGANKMTGDFEWLFMWPGAAINWLDPAQLFRLEPDYIGPKNGSAIYPAQLPAVALWGLATDLNAASGANFGTGGPIDNLGTDVTQTVSGTLPPNLTLEATKLSSTQVRVNVIGNPKSGVTITATSSVNGAQNAALPVSEDGYVDFTFPAGGQTITITNNGGYTNPSTVTLP